MYKNFDRLYSNIKEKFDKIGIAFAILFTLYSWTAISRLTSYHSFCTIGEERLISDRKGENNVIRILSKMQYVHEGKEMAGRERTGV